MIGLALSTDGSPANATKVASVTGYTNSRQWTKFSSQRSAASTLQAGQVVYVKALQKDGLGVANLAA